MSSDVTTLKEGIEKHIHLSILLNNPTATNLDISKLANLLVKSVM
jgi:predicted transcriptional regulator